VAEQSDILARHGPGLDMDVLGEMEVLHRNITEALRIHPPLLLVMRYAKQGFSVTTSKGQTYSVPAVSGGPLTAAGAGDRGGGAGDGAAGSLVANPPPLGCAGLPPLLAPRMPHARRVQSGMA
jgi:hypothetical protein